MKYGDMELSVWACGVDHGPWIFPVDMKVICPCGVETMSMEEYNNTLPKSEG